MLCGLLKCKSLIFFVLHRAIGKISHLLEAGFPLFGIFSHKRGKEKTFGFEQAYRVTWRNILDWVQVQMALIEIEMTKLEEVFLPYMVAQSGKTYFETLENRQFQLESGTNAQEGEVIHL